MLFALLLVVTQDSMIGVSLPALTVSDLPHHGLPLARTVLDRATLLGLRSGATLDEALARAPGVVTQFRGTFALDTRLVVRGSGARSAFGVRGVTVLLDGVPQTLPDGQAGLGQIDVSSLSQIEIVRGAAGALYGNGAGGVILASSRSALFDDPWIAARASGGSYGTSMVSASAGVAPAAGLLVSAARNRQDGFRAYSAGELRQASLAAEAMPGSARVRVRVRVSDLVRAENPGALDSAQLAANPRQANPRNVAYRAGKQATEWQASADVLRSTGFGDYAASVYYIARALDNPLASTWVKLERHDVGVSLAGSRQIGRRRRIAVRGGLDVQRQADARRNFANDSGRIGTAATLDQRETVTSLGARGGISVPFSERSVLVAGLRLDRIGFAVRDHLTADGDASAHRAMGALSWSAALEHRMGAWRAWLSGGTAFETPTTTELARPGTGGFNPTLDPQRTLQGELGFAWSRRGARFSVTAYRSRVRDALVQREEPTMPGRFFFENAARVSLRGLEAEAAAQPAVWLGLAGSLTLTRHRYDRFPTDSAPLDGRFVPGLPRSTAYALASLGRRTGPQLEVELVAQGRTWADDGNTAFAPAATQLHLRAGWTLRRLSIFGGMRNVTDARVVGSVNVNGAARRFFEPAPGRTSYIGIETRL